MLKFSEWRDARRKRLVKEWNDTHAEPINSGDPLPREIINEITPAAYYQSCRFAEPHCEVSFANERIDFSSLSNTEMSRVDFSGADLRATKFTHSRFSYCNFEGAKLSGANFTSAFMYTCNFRNADLSNTNLIGLDATYSNFRLANIADSNARNTQFDHCDMAGSTLDRTSFMNASLNEVSLDGASAIHCNFRMALMDEVDFHDADLSGSRFERTSLMQSSILTAKNVDSAVFSTILGMSTRHDVLAYKIADGKLMLVAGCWESRPDAFLDRIESVIPDAQRRTAYLANALAICAMVSTDDVALLLEAVTQNAMQISIQSARIPDITDNIEEEADDDE